MADFSDSYEEWVLEAVGDEPVDAETNIYFRIDGDRISGFDGCNHFSGTLDQLGTTRSTQRGCPPGVLRIHFEKARQALLDLDRRAPIVTLPVGEGGRAVTFRRVDVD